MPGDQAPLSPEAVDQAVRSIIVAVLFVPQEDVQSEKSLIEDLGAESIDFMDLVFRLEDVLGKKVTVARFDQWLRARTAKGGSRDVTVATLVEFAQEEAGLGGV